MYVSLVKFMYEHHHHHRLLYLHCHHNQLTVPDILLRPSGIKNITAAKLNFTAPFGQRGSQVIGRLDGYWGRRGRKEGEGMEGKWVILPFLFPLSSVASLPSSLIII